ncbi:MAG: hypothetical protein WC889_14610, partial [Myxococcota bacterium]
KPSAVAGETTPEGNAARRDFRTLVLLACLFTVGPVAFLGSPKYGGVKLFLPFFPFLALLGAMAVQWIADTAARRVKALAGTAPRALADVSLAVLMVLPAGVSLARVHPYHLSYYNAFIGGLPGAAGAGMERQYYDIFYRSLADWMGANLPQGARVTFEPNNKEYVRSAPWYKADGILRGDIQITDMRSAQFLVLTHEERWPQWPMLRDRYASYPVLQEIKVEGVPILTVYRLK